MVSAVGGQTGPARASQAALTFFASRAMRTKRDTFHACQAWHESVLQAGSERQARVGCRCSHVAEHADCLWANTEGLRILQLSSRPRTLQWD